MLHAVWLWIVKRFAPGMDMGTEFPPGWPPPW